MYALCDSSEPLSSTVFLNLSYVDSLVWYGTNFAGKDDVVIFRDLRSKGKLNDLQYIGSVTRKALNKLIDKYKNK